MVQRLFLDRVDTEAGGTAVGGQHHPAVDILADKTGAALAGMQLAVTRAEVALQAAIGQRVPPAGGVPAIDSHG